MTKLKLIDNMRAKRILLLGDPMMDVYHFGEVQRVCPEAPVPVFIDNNKPVVKPGGAFNVMENLRALGLVVIPWFPATHVLELKHRYMVGHHLVLRVDQEVNYNTTPDTTCYDGEVDAVVISDYAKGWVTPERCATVLARRVPTIVDPKGADWSKYAGAMVVCPNEKEYRVPGPMFNGFVLEKRGAEGAMLHVPGCMPQTFRATAKRVYDVTGAGDVVVSVMAATIAAGGSVAEGATLAVAAATWSVGQIGTTAVSNDQLQEICRENGFC